MTTINISEACAAAGPPPPVTPGVFRLRVFLTGPLDGGHLSGPFGTREAAERAMTAVLCRENVQKVELVTGGN